MKRIWIFIAIVAIATMSAGQTVITQYGTTITQAGSYILGNDLNCVGPFSISGSNITLDCNGKTITGAYIPVSGSGITIKNGNFIGITSQGIVISVGYGSGNSVRNNTFSNNGYISLSTPNSSISNNTGSFVIVMDYSGASNCSISNNSSSKSLTINSPSNSISNNTFTLGISVISNNNLISNNVAGRNGISVAGSGNYGCGNTAITYYNCGASCNYISDSDFTSVEKNSPLSFSLFQNYPNPFNPSTTITYSLPQAGFVKLTVYDIRGREVATLVNGRQPAGEYHIDFNGSIFVSGVYLCRLETGKTVLTRKMNLIK